MTDIFLYQGENNPPDIKLRDPTSLAGTIAYVLTCNSGNYSFSGIPATFKLEHGLSCASGSYIYAGKTANLVIGYQLTCSSGTYTYAGQPASLRVSHGLICNVASYVYSGKTATLQVDHSLSCSSGSYIYTGITATLNYVPGGIDYTLVCNSGIYLYSGMQAELTVVSPIVWIKDTHDPGITSRDRQKKQNRRIREELQKQFDRIELKETVKPQKVKSVYQPIHSNDWMDISKSIKESSIISSKRNDYESDDEEVILRLLA
jgi:hypothetical protein